MCPLHECFDCNQPIARNELCLKLTTGKPIYVFFHGDKGQDGMNCYERYRAKRREEQRDT